MAHNVNTQHIYMIVRYAHPRFARTTPRMRGLRPARMRATRASYIYMCWSLTLPEKAMARPLPLLLH